MPSNKDMIKAIAEISEELGKDAPETEGKNNGELANILSALKVEKKEADKDLTPDDAAKAAAEAKKEAAAAKEEAAAKKPPFYVKEGKSLITKRGILSDGDEIKADDLAGGKGTLDDFVKSGHVVKS